MASNINTVLADCETKTKQLVAEIEKYKAAGVLSNQVAQSLEELCRALRATHSSVKPLTTLFVNKILLALAIFNILNTGLLIAILIMIAKK